MSTLYIVATPIGNLEDISMRALRTLRDADFIICEDTRVTGKLLAHYEIKKPLVSYFQHSRLTRISEIIARMREGTRAALVTDAGTPGISDPGGILIAQMIRQLGSGVRVVPIPGPCALIAALSAAGLPADKFRFFGFPPHKKGRQKFWRLVVECDTTAVFYESPHRIIKSLLELQIHLTALPSGDLTHVIVCRELTKMYESIYRGTISSVLEAVRNDPIKGEYVVIIAAEKYAQKHAEL